MLRNLWPGRLGTSCASWLPIWRPRRRQGRMSHAKPVLCLWMSGGPSRDPDTFDMKPGHANGGEFKTGDDVSWPPVQRALAETCRTRRSTCDRAIAHHERRRSRGATIRAHGYLPTGEVATLRLHAHLAKTSPTRCCRIIHGRAAAHINPAALRAWVSWGPLRTQSSLVALAPCRRLGIRRPPWPT